MLDFVGRVQQFTWYKDGYGYEKLVYKKRKRTEAPATEVAGGTKIN